MSLPMNIDMPDDPMEFELSVDPMEPSADPMVLKRPEDPIEYNEYDDFELAEEMPDDPIKDEIFEEANERYRAEEVTFIELKFEKYWLIQQAKSNPVSVEGLASFDDDSESDEISDEISDERIHPLLMRLAKCTQRTFELTKRHRNLKSDAAANILTMINDFAPPTTKMPFIGARKKLDPLVMVLYAVFADKRTWKEEQGNTSQLLRNLPNHFTVEVVTHVKLCGGVPSDTKLLELSKSASIDSIVEEILNALRPSAESLHPGRLPKVNEEGDLSWLEEKSESNKKRKEQLSEEEQLYFQFAPSLNTLRSGTAHWRKLSERTVEQFKASSKKGHKVFIIHRNHMLLPERIAARQKVLETDDHYKRREWSWPLFLTVEEQLAAPMPYVWWKFVPAFKAVPRKKRPAEEGPDGEVQQRKRQDDGGGKGDGKGGEQGVEEVVEGVDSLNDFSLPMRPR